jgi:mannan endo-1,4-beta-mannosidase
MLSHRLVRACGWATTAAVLVLSPALMPPWSAVAGASALPATLHIGPAAAGVAAPVTTGLVTRSGNQLMLGGQPFRFTGANLYWLGLDDNIRDSTGSPTYPTKYRIRNALQAAADAGMTVIRSHTLGISVGCGKCFEPSRGVFRAAALASADYAIAQAGSLGLKIVVPLTDQWRWYHGGESTFTGWRGYPNQPAGSNAANNPAQRAAEAHFYTDPLVMADYKAYISRLLGHVNPYTGLKYKDDPTIMAWETGNEIWTANPSWTQEIARFIKHDIGARQLIADGTAATGMRTVNAAINGVDVDILGGHFYPIDTAWAATDAATAQRSNKAYVIGEYAWTSVAATDRLLSMVESTPSISGALLWTLLPYQENRLPEPHGDGYAFYSPATTPTMQTVLDRIKLNAARLRSD